MIKKEPHRRICTRFSGHRFKIEKWVSIMDVSLNAEESANTQIFVECAVEIH